MAKRYPGASYQPLGRQTEAPMHAHDIICVHTMVGSLTGTDAMFGRDGYGGTESHFGTGGDGECIQWQDLAFQADANLDGNPRVISIENADMGAPFPKWTGSNVPGFTLKQTERLIDLIAWLCSREAHANCPVSWKCHREGIPAQLIPDSRPGRRGVAVHRQGIDGNFPTTGILAGRVSGGEQWSTAFGKACPGDERIRQLVDVILPAVRRRQRAKAQLPGKTVLTRVTTANIPPGAEADFPAVAKASDVLLTQEDQHRDAGSLMPRGWTTIQFQRGSTGRCSVHLRTNRFQNISSSNPLLNAANGLTFPGAARYACMVRARDKLTGRWWTFMSGQLVPHADDEHGGITTYPRGRLAVAPAISTIARILPPSVIGQEVIGIDANVDWDRDWTHHDPTDLLERMAAAGFISDGQALGNGPDTHGSHEYDWILARLTDGEVRMVSRTVAPKRKSDHRAKTVVFESTIRRSWRQPSTTHQEKP